MTKNKTLCILLTAALTFTVSACANTNKIDCRSADNPFRNFTVDESSQKRMAETIETLSSSDFSGRLSGTEGNKKAEDYILDRFKSMNLISPEGIADYRQPFSHKTFITMDRSRLYTLNEDGTADIEFNDIEDFKSVTYWKTQKISGFAEGKLVYVKDPSDLSRSNMANFDDSILLFDETLIESTGNVFAFINRYGHIVGDAGGWIFDWDIRSNGHFPVSRHVRSDAPFNNDSGVVSFLAGEETFDSLKTAAETGKSGKMVSNINFTDTASSNLIAYIEGSDPEKTLMISAHLDHVGDNMNGTYNPGALDNASGVSAMLEVAEILSNGPVPVFNIVFVAFNAEEEGLFGSLHYSEHPCFPLDKTVVLNLDMVGSRGANATLISGRNGELIGELIKCFEEMGMEAETAEIEASDHTPLLEKNACAVLIVEENDEVLHRPSDTYCNSIDPERLLRIEKSILLYIDRTAY